MAKITIKEPKGIDVSKSALLIDKNNARHTSNISINNPIKAITNEGLGYVRQDSVSLVEKVVSIFQIGESEETFVIAGDAQKYWDIFTPVAEDANHIGLCKFSFIYGNEIYMTIEQFNLTTFQTDKYEIQVKNFSNILVRKWGVKGTGNGEFDGISGIYVDADKVYVADTNNLRIQKFDTDGTYDTQWVCTSSSTGPYGIFVYNDEVYAKTFTTIPDNTFVYNLTGTEQRQFNLADFFNFTIDNDIIYGGDVNYIYKYNLSGVFQESFATNIEDRLNGLAIFNNIIYASTGKSIAKFNKLTELPISSYGTEASYFSDYRINRFYNNNSMQVYNNRLYISDAAAGTIRTIL